MRWDYLLLISYATEVWEWESNFIPHFTVQAITYPSYDLSYFMLVKMVPYIFLNNWSSVQCVWKEKENHLGKQ